MMNYFKITHLSFYLLLVSLTILHGQESTPGGSSNSNEKSWLEMIQDPDVNFYEVQDLFNKYWENREDYKGNGWKVFKRWEYINHNRVLPDGNLQTPGYVFEEYNKYMKDAGKSASGTWAIQGPTTYVGNNTGQPTGMGRINAIAFHPTDVNTIFAGSPSGGFWKTTDGGNTWSNLSNNLATLGVSSILVHPSNPDIIYIGSGDRDANDALPLGVFKTTDGGVTWTQIDNTMGNVVVGAMLMYPSNPNTILAATSSGIFKTTDGGNTWSQKATGNFKDLQFKPGDPTVVYAVKIATPSEFHRSTNTGDSWTQISSGIPSSGIGSRMVIGVSAANGNYVYLLQIKSSDGTLANILRSTDSGVNFSTTATGPNILGYNCDGSGTASQATYDLCMTVDPNNINNVFVGGINNWMSTDAGVNWTISSHWVGSSFGVPCASSVHADQHCYAWSPLNGRLYVGHDGGIHYSANGGTTWNEITNNLAITQIYKIGQGTSNVNYTLFGCQDNGSAATTNGSSFFTTRGGDGMETLIDYSNSNYCYNTYHSGLINRSSTGPTGSYAYALAGNGVNGMDESGAWVTPYFLHKSDHLTMFVGLKNVWRTNNVTSSPPTWTKISTGEIDNCEVLEQSSANLNIIYAVRYGSLKRTDNANDAAGSVTWSSCPLPGGNTPTDIKAHPTDANIVYATAAYNIYKSTDKGLTWTDISSNLPELFINCLVIDKNDNEGIYIGNQTGVWYKDATLTDWALFSSGLPPVDVRELEIYYDVVNPSNNRIKAGTYGRGLWQSDLMQVNAINPSNFSAVPVSLNQIDLSWTKNSSNQNVLIATSPTSTFGVPADGVSYSIGNTLPSGGGTVIYTGPLSLLNHTSLSTGVTYYYKIWSVNGSTQYSAGLPPIYATTYSHGWTSGAGTSDWFTAGNWGSGSVPTPSDNVYIPSPPATQPQINAAGATCGNIKIEAGASLSMSGTTAYTLTVSGDWSNNGTFNRGIGTVEFNGSNSLQIIKGSSTTAFNILKVNKGSQDKILEATSLISLNAAANPLVLTSGTFKLSSASSIAPFTTSVTIGTGAGLWNNGGTITSGNFSWTLNPGLLRNSSGSITIGTSAGNSLTYMNGAAIIIEGGNVNIAGRLSPNSGTSVGSYSQTGGILTVNIFGSTSTSRAPFEINSGVPFTMSGGTIIIQRASSNAADYINLSSTSSVTGGTLQIGNSSTPASQTIRINSLVPLYNLAVNATNSPIVQLVTNGLTVIKDITIAGGTLNANNLNISIGGNWSNGGTFSPGTGTISFNGTASQLLGGASASTFNNLTINGTDVSLGITGSSKLTTVNSALTINTGKKLTVASNQALTVSGTLTNNAGEPGLVIKSDASGTGSLINPTTGVEAEVERFLTKMKWHFIGMPVEGGVAGVFHLPSGHADIFLKTHIEATNTWGPYIVPINTPLTQGRGYECWVGDPFDPSNQMDETIVFPGKLGASNYTTGSGSFYALEFTNGHGLNLICNPYPSALQANISSWSKTNVANKVWTWAPDYGNYVFWGSGDDYGSGSFGSMTSGIIPEMQAFFIEATGSNPSLTIPQSSRVHSSQAYYKDSEIPANTLRFDVTGNGYEDAIFISFNKHSTNIYDTDYDMEKLFGLVDAPQLYSNIPGKKLSINTLPQVEEALIIPIGFECGVAGTFTITVSGIEGFDQDVEFYFEDLQEGTIQNLKANPGYTFISDPMFDSSRFLLHFGNPNTIDESLPKLIRVYADNGEIHIMNLTQDDAHAFVYDLVGKKVAETDIERESRSIIKTESGTGYYIVKIQNGKQLFTEKILLR